MIKRLFALAVVFAMLSFYACKQTEKKEEPKLAPSSSSGKTGSKTRTSTPRSGRAQVVDLQIYNGESLVSSVPPDQFDTTVSTKTIKAGRQQTEVSAALLSDLLTKFNLAGKSVVLSSQAQSVAVTWDEAMDGQIYICKGKESQFRLLDQGRRVRLPGQLTKIQVSDKEASEVASARQAGRQQGGRQGARQGERRNRENRPEQDE